MRNVAVVAGGPSREHSVSKWSGERVLEALDRARYAPIPVLIERDGSWRVSGEVFAGPLEGALALRARGCECVLLALHGPYGEDGTLQGFLRAAGMPFAGSGVRGSAIANDKVRSKRLAAAAGVAVARDVLVPPSTAADAAALGFPLYVKNPYEGSTLGMARVKDAGELARAVAELSPSCDALLCEEAVPGRELTAAVLEDEDGTPRALPLVEIRAPGGYFDFESKYTAGAAEEIVPAPVPEDVARAVQESALAVHRALGLEGMSRSDFILRDDSAAVFLEANTIPGLTANSLLPKAAAAAGIGFAELLTRLIERALR